MDTTLLRLNTSVASWSVFSQKVRLCHWNVEGPGFLDLHEFFGDYYDYLSEKVDVFAERIRALDAFPVATYSEFLGASRIKETPSIIPGTMVTELISDTQLLVADLRSWLVDEADLPTQDMYISTIQELEKKLWMMRALSRSGAHG